MPESTERPILRMPSSAPQWLREAKANREQLQYAFEVACENTKLARARYDDLCEQRDAACQAVTTQGSPTARNEQMILGIQHLIVEAYAVLERHMRDAADLRIELMGVSS